MHIFSLFQNEKNWFENEYSDYFDYAYSKNVHLWIKTYQTHVHTNFKLPYGKKYIDLGVYDKRKCNEKLFSVLS